MARNVTVVISQGQSANPAKRGLEEDLVAALLFEKGVEVTVIPHLYDLAPDGTGMLCLQGITTNLVVLSWLYPRGARWTLSRNGINGHEGRSLLINEDAEDEDEAEPEEQAEDEDKGIGIGPIPNRHIYCIDLRSSDQVDDYVREIRRIAAETNVETVSLMGWIQGNPKPEQLQRYLDPSGAGNGHGNGGSPPAETPLPIVTSATTDAAKEAVRVDEETRRRWYPVIDFSRCTNCLECLDFCLFGVYGVNTADNILVEQPDNCKKGCPACSRVCPENAIIFPQHKTPAIAGSPGEGPGSLKIDLSQLFGAPSAMEVAALERDRELVADGREAVGMTVGIPRRQAEKSDEPRDDLDDLVDQLDDLDL